MVRHKGLESAPRDYVIDGEWPDAALRDDAPPEADVVRRICRELKRVLEHENVSLLAEQAGISRSTLYGLVAGERWPDLVTIIRLQLNLPEAQFWPIRPPSGR